MSRKKYKKNSIYFFYFLYFSIYSGRFMQSTIFRQALRAYPVLFFTFGEAVCCISFPE